MNDDDDKTLNTDMRDVLKLRTISFLQHYLPADCVVFCCPGHVQECFNDVLLCCGITFAALLHGFLKL